MTFDVFYCCYGRDEEVPGSNPIQLEADEIWARARRVLADPDDFFGVIDADGTTLQVMVEPDGYWTEVPAPERKGSYGTRLTQPQLRDLFENLPSSFSASTIAGATFTSW